ncbi:MAG: hypothetical protein IT464_01440 [Planctomycetes bacterium]|nr:hypothetical protein [Planctomycetota bacterium]
MMTLFDLPFTPDTPAPAPWTSALEQGAALARRMQLQLERERVEHELARVKALLHASTAERRRMAQACLDMSARQVSLKIRQARVDAAHARGWILAEMREQIELLFMKDSIAELGEASPFCNDPNWRRIGHRASEQRLAELREKLKATEPRKRTGTASRRRKRTRASDGEVYESIGETYERYESSLRTSTPAKQVPVPDVVAAVEPACAAPATPTRLSRDDDSAQSSRPAGAPSSFDFGLQRLGRGPESMRPTGAQRRALLAGWMSCVLHLQASSPKRLRRRIAPGMFARVCRHATRAANCQAGPGGACLRTAA